MYIQTYVYIHTYLHKYMHTHIHIHTYTHMHTYLQIGHSSLELFRARVKEGYGSRLFQYLVALLILFAFILDVVQAEVSIQSFYFNKK